MPSSSVAIALANALDVSTTYLLSPTVVSLESVEFRKLASTKVRERARVEATVLDHMDRYLQVEELLDITSSVLGSTRWRPVPRRHRGGWRTDCGEGTQGLEPRRRAHPQHDRAA